MPLVLERRIRGAVAVVWPRGSSQVEEVDISYVEALMELASSLLRRADLDSAVRDSEERFRQVAENIRGFIWLRNPASPQVPVRERRLRKHLGTYA